MPVQFPQIPNPPNLPDSSQTKATTFKPTAKSLPPEPKHNWLDLFSEKVIQGVGKAFGETGKIVARTIVIDLLPIDSPEYKTQKIYDYSTHLKKWVEKCLESSDKEKIAEAIDKIDGRFANLANMGDSESIRMERTELSDLYDNLIIALHRHEHQSEKLQTEDPQDHA